jgi:ComF family protein
MNTFVEQIEPASGKIEAGAAVEGAGDRSADLTPALVVRKPGRLRAFADRLTELVVPSVCAACHCPVASHHGLCADCWREVQFIRSPLCDRLGLPLPYDTGGSMISAAAAANPPPYDRARAVGAYSGTLKQLVHDFKFRDAQELRRLFVRWMLQAGAEMWPEAELIVPIPLHRWRLLQRRFNQSAVLAREVSRTTRIPFAPHHLQRLRATRRQLGLTRQQRQSNVSGALSVPQRYHRDIQNKHVVLVDDVITTGATVAAASRALRQAGARKVDVLVLALVTHEADMEL